MEKSEQIKNLQTLLSHHYVEIKRLQNATDETYRHENIAFLDKECRKFKSILIDLTNSQN